MARGCAERTRDPHASTAAGRGAEQMLDSTDDLRALDALPGQVPAGGRRVAEAGGRNGESADRDEILEQERLSRAVLEIDNRSVRPAYFPRTVGRRDRGALLWMLLVLGMLGVLLTLLTIGELNRSAPYVAAPEPEPEPEPQPEPEPEPDYLSNPCPGRFTEPVTREYPAFVRWAAMDDHLRVDRRGNPLPAWISPRDSDFPCAAGGRMGRCGAREECCTCCTGPGLTTKEADQECDAQAQAEGWVSSDYYGQNGRPHRPFSDLLGGADRCETLLSPAGAVWADVDGDGCSAYGNACAAGVVVTNTLSEADREIVQRWFDDPAQYDTAHFRASFRSFETWAPSEGRKRIFCAVLYYK